jgi:branched-chain amino acid transport system substrate-binding protein
MTGKRTLLVGLSILVLLAGCAPAPTPEVIRETVEVPVELTVEVPVERTVEVPVEVEAEGLNEVRVGFPMPLTGRYAVGAWQIIEAVRMAADVVNNEYPSLDAIPFGPTAGLPNHDGAQIRLLIPDSQGDGENALADSERLITEDKVHVLFGGYASSISAVVSDVAERYEIPYVCGAASSHTLGERGYKWFFRQQPHDYTFTESMFQFLEEWGEESGNRLETVALFYEDTLFGADTADAAKMFAPQYGYEIVEDIAYSAETSSLVSEVERLKVANPDVVIATSYVADAILFVRTCKELDYVPPMILAHSAGYTDPSFIEGEIAKDAEGFATRMGMATDSQREIVQQMTALFRERTGSDVTGAGGKAFQSLITLADALNRAKSFAPEDIRQALLETDIPLEMSVLPQGIRFDPETGENIYARAVIMQMQGGKYQTVWPFEEAVVDVIYPLPKWSER